MDSKTANAGTNDGSTEGTQSAKFLPALLIFIATISAQMISLALGRIDETHSFAATLIPSLIFLSVLTLPSCLIGSHLGPKVSLGAPRITALFSRGLGTSTPLFEGMTLVIILSLALGGFLVLLRVLTQPYLPEDLPAYGHRGVVGGLAVTIGAAVGEEVWFRLGLMTLTVWAITRLLGHRQPSPALLWGVILFSAIVFGAAHLPQVIAYGAGSPFALVATVLGNVLVGTLYGWCYWKRGLLGAIVAHFTVDLVLHVLTALF